MASSPQRAIAPILLLTAALAGNTDAPVPYPAEFRKWAVVRSVVVGQENKNYAVNGGFHHYYANEKAMEGFLTGNFPEGSVVVDERLELRQESGATLEGPRKSVAVMEKQTARHKNTGGWGFDVFAGEDRTQGASATIRAACFACHSQRSEHNFLFSEFRQ